VVDGSVSRRHLSRDSRRLSDDLNVKNVSCSFAEATS
jgi:hypothetical protein